MHISALNFGKLFFDTYCAGLKGATVHDIGAQNVNGSLKDVLPSDLGYVGIDFVKGNGVDIVLEDPYRLPFADDSLDVIVSSSCFEHSQFFWLSFLEMMRVLKPEGLLYLNVPSNGSFHRYPVDCWRFYPDSGRALEAWGRHSGYGTTLLESCVGERSPQAFEEGGAWNDFVAVFVKDSSEAYRHTGRMLPSLPGCWNGLDGLTDQSVNKTFLTPDHQEVVRLMGLLCQAEAEAAAGRTSAETQREALEAELLACRNALENGRHEAAALAARLAASQAEAATTKASVAEVRTAWIAAVEPRTSAVKDARIQTLELELRDANELLGQHERKLDAVQVRAEHAEKHASELHQQLDAVLRSRSWRATNALRSLTTLARRVRNRARSAAATVPVAQPASVSVAQAQLVPAEPFDQPTAQAEAESPHLIAERHAALDAETAVIGPSGLFDEVYYRSHYPDMRLAPDPLRDFCDTGWQGGRNPSAAFDTQYYLECNPDIRDAGMNPLLHYVLAGAAEERPCLPPHRRERPVDVIDKEYREIQASGRFDSDFYLAMYADIQPPPTDPLRHYCETGWTEGRNPSDQFDTNAYLAAYSDIRDAGLNPLWHFTVAGATELRYPDPLDIVRCEDDIGFGHVSPDVKLVALYHATDWRPMWAGDSQNSLRPHEDIGFYDSADSDVLRQQARMARRHGLHGFCFVVDGGDAQHPTLLALEACRSHPDIEVPFCAALQLHENSLSDRVLSGLRAALESPRWLRMDGRPMLLVSGVADDIAVLRRALDVEGAEPVFLVSWNAANGALSGSDAALRAPSRKGVHAGEAYAVLAARGVNSLSGTSSDEMPVYPMVSLSAARREDAADSRSRKRMRLKHFRRWLDSAIAFTRSNAKEDHRFVFADAWNDWQAGAVLEPDVQGGYGSLNETTCALIGVTERLPTPKVTVVVTNYNHERFLRRRLDSIYSQTYKNIEVLLLDDCSTDHSRVLLDSYAAAHPDITRTIFNQTNSGSAFRQWARGIQAATGELVWIAESDDFCDPHFLEVLVRSFDDEAVMLASAKCTFVDSSESPLYHGFLSYISDLPGALRWEGPYSETAHNEVRHALGIKNTIPNASGVVFRRPIDMPLLTQEWWLSMRVAGDWVFYLHLIRGGKVAYDPAAVNYFRRYEGSVAEATSRHDVMYREVGIASRVVAELYDVPVEVLERCREGYRSTFLSWVGGTSDEFDLLYDYDAVVQARRRRQPNIMVSTMGFIPGGAEIFPIRLANEFKRQGLPVLLLSTGHNLRVDGIRRLLRNDVPVVETQSIEATRLLIEDFGIEVLNSHQWHVQKYPSIQANAFDGLPAHVATLHGMIEHGNAFGVSPDELRAADARVSTWVYTADKNLAPFAEIGLPVKDTSRFVKLPNGIQTPVLQTVPRVQMNIPEDAFVLCCVSRAIPDKGWQETIDAVEQARVLSGRDIRLVLVGNGPVYDQFRSTGVPAFVHLVGFSENSAGYYASADMGIMLTRFRSESFPMTIIDCLFAGRPYIATDVGDIPNMLTCDDGVVAGGLVGLVDWEVPVEEAAQAIAAFSSNKALYRAAVERVPVLAARFRIETVAGRYAELFCKVAASDKAGWQ